MTDFFSHFFLNLFGSLEFYSYLCIKKIKTLTFLLQVWENKHRAEEK